MGCRTGVRSRGYLRDLRAFGKYGNEHECQRRVEGILDPLEHAQILSG